MLVFTPVRHVERMSDMSTEELLSFFNDFSFFVKKELKVDILLIFSIFCFIFLA